MATLAIPIGSENAAYSFQIDLEGVTYTLDFSFNERSEEWQMAIYDAAEENLLLGSMPVLTNIAINFPHTSRPGVPPGYFIALDETGNNQNANRDNFGSDIKLFYEES